MTATEAAPTPQTETKKSPAGAGGERSPLYSTIVDAQGVVLGSREPKAPAMKMEVYDHSGGDASSFKIGLFYMPPGKRAFVDVLKHQQEDELHSSAHVALDAAREALESYLYDVYADALESVGDDDTDTTDIESLRRFIGTCRDAAIVKRADIKGQKSVRYRWLNGKDLLLALRLAHKFFKDDDRRFSLDFRFRSHSDGSDWTAGRSVDGEKMQILCRIEKISGTAAQVQRDIRGFASQFVVTINELAWNHEAMTDRKRQAALFEQLSRIGYDEEKKTSWVAPMPAMPQEAALKEFGDVYASDVDFANAINELVSSAIDHGVQLEMFGLTLAEAGGKNAMHKVIPAGRPKGQPEPVSAAAGM